MLSYIKEIETDIGVKIKYRNAPSPHVPHIIAELKFASAPGVNELIKACGTAVNGARPQSNSIMGWRHLYNSSDKKEYTIFCVDIWEELQREKEVTDNYWICEAKITCNHCRAVYKGWIKRPRKEGNKGTYYHNTDYCPQCPITNIDTWLIATVRIMTEEPFYVDLEQKEVRSIKIKYEEKPAAKISVDIGDFPD